MAKASHFLPSLYRMCNNDTPNHRACITWNADGTSFRVSNTESFSRDILPLYFKHNNYASFVRQLNMYGFHRSTDPRPKAVEPGMQMVEHFTHDFFRRGQEHLISNITRKTSSSGRSRGKTSASATSASEPESGDEDVRRSVAQLQRSMGMVNRMDKDVDILKGNQMQLAQTVQILVTDNKALREELARQHARIAQQNETISEVVRFLQNAGITGSGQLRATAPAATARGMAGARPTAAQGSFPELGAEVYDLTGGTGMEVDGLDIEKVLSSADANPWPEY